MVVLGSHMNGDEPQESAEHTTIPPQVKSALAVLTNEVHASTVAVGKLMGEVGGMRTDLRTLEQRVSRMRGRLESVPDAARGAAEDTASHKIAELRQELEKQEREKLERENEGLRKAADIQQKAANDRKAEARGRNLLIALCILGPIVTHIIEHWH